MQCPHVRLSDHKGQGKAAAHAILAVPSYMRSLSFVSIAALLVLAAALPYDRPVGIPIYKRSTLTKDGIVDLDAARSHIAYSKR